MAEQQGWHIEEEQQLVAFESNCLVVDSVALAPRGGSPSYDQWAGGIDRIRKVYGAVKYWLGDLILMGESLFSEEASQVIDQSFLTEQEVKKYTYVAKQVAPTTRAHAQSWDHANAVAHLKPEEQLEWLDKSRAGGSTSGADEPWSARKLAAEIAKANAEEGKTIMRWWLVVECGTEAKRDKLAERLEGEGFGIKKQEKLAKVPKAKKARKKKGEVTAQKKRRGAPKMNTVKRPPK